MTCYLGKGRMEFKKFAPFFNFLILNIENRVVAEEYELSMCQAQLRIWLEKFTRSFASRFHWRIFGLFSKLNPWQQLYDCSLPVVPFVFFFKCSKNPNTLLTYNKMIEVWLDWSLLRGNCLLKQVIERKIEEPVRWGIRNQ
jgi:hypothetical protein